MRRDIQGLRAFAVLVVVLYHGQLGFAGGFVGVDVFFVISGFVITGVLFRDSPSSPTLRSTLAMFYTRRIRRLLPALGAMVGVTVLLSLVLESSLREQSRTGWSAVASLLFSANFKYLTMSDGYFSLGSQTNPLLHVWSLSIEEQFYFIFPAAFAFIVSRRGIRRAGQWLALGAAVSLLASILFSYGTTTGVGSEKLAFYLPLTRAWEFLAGSLVYLIGIKDRDWFGPIGRYLLVIFGAAGLLASTLFFHDRWNFPGFIAIVPVLATMAILHAGRIQEVSFLSWRPLVWIGDRSYGWYLWHWPMIVFALHEYPRSNMAAPLAAALSLIPASLSYTLIEQPIRNRRGWGKISTKIVWGSFVAIPLIVSGTVALRADIADTTDHVSTTTDVLSSIADCAAQERLCLPRNSKSDVAVLVGDSHAGMIAANFETASTSTGFTPAVSSLLGCPFVGTNISLYLYNFESSNLMTTTDCSREYEALLEWAREVRPSVVFLVNNAPLYTQVPGFDERFDLRVACMTANGSSCLPSSSSTDQISFFEERLATTVDELAQYAKTVVVSLPMPQMFREPDQFIRADGFEGTPRSDINEFRSLLLPMYERLLVNPHVILWDPMKYLCTDEVCPNGDGTGPWYSDNGHLGPRGASRLDEPLKGLLAELAKG